jgi:hypothetical protein
MFQFQCFPLYSLLLAMDNPVVNLLVLDMEGEEFNVLKTIPWQKVKIEVRSQKVVPIRSRLDHQLLSWIWFLTSL